eukprot:Rmarinus@m.22295
MVITTAVATKVVCRATAGVSASNMPSTSLSKRPLHPFRSPRRYHQVCAHVSESRRSPLRYELPSRGVSNIMGTKEDTSICVGAGGCEEMSPGTRSFQIRSILTEGRKSVQLLQETTPDATPMEGIKAVPSVLPRMPSVLPRMPSVMALAASAGNSVYSEDSDQDSHPVPVRSRLRPLPCSPGPPPVDPHVHKAPRSPPQYALRAWPVDHCPFPWNPLPCSPVDPCAYPRSASSKNPSQNIFRALPVDVHLSPPDGAGMCERTRLFEGSRVTESPSPCPLSRPPAPHSRKMKRMWLPLSCLPARGRLPSLIARRRRSVSPCILPMAPSVV